MNLQRVDQSNRQIMDAFALRQLIEADIENWEK